MSFFFDEALQTVYVHEGGAKFTDDPSDPGGATKYGISLRFLKAEGVDINHDDRINADDVKALTPELAASLYHDKFWNLIRGDEIQNRVIAAKVFDVAVNAGDHKAVILLQSALGLVEDGNFGPKTLEVVNSTSCDTVLEKLIAELTKFYNKIVTNRPKSAKYLHGWLVRASCTLYNPCVTCKWAAKHP